MAFFSLRTMVQAASLATVITLATFLPSTAAYAAKDIVLTYGFLRHSIPVSEITRFAETGKQSPSLALLVSLSQQDPALLREALNRTVPVNYLVLQGALNSSHGDSILAEASQVVHPNRREESVPALRAAIATSAQDNRVSLLEFFENYPTDTMYVDGEKLMDAVQRARPMIEAAGDGIETVEDVLGALGF